MSGSTGDNTMAPGMRVLVCDQDSQMLESVARGFDVDIASSKATCIDLMRANPFDVLIAGERLSDGSGLELLSQVATRWPDTLRVLVIEPERLRLLQGRLAPFRLHATMRYPIREDELDGVLADIGELLAEAEDRPDLQPIPPTVPATPKSVKTAPIPQPMKPSSPSTRAPRVPSHPPRAVRHTARSAQVGQPVGAPQPPATPPVPRKLGNYTPLGSPDDAALRIIQREFDPSLAPLAARAMRMRERALRSRTPKEKLGTLATHLRDSLKKLLHR